MVKKKTAKKREFKVGQVVKVIWIDSGWTYDRAGIKAENCNVFEMTTYGLVASEDKRRVVIAANISNSDRSPGNEHYQVIWLPSIQSWRVLR